MPSETDIANRALSLLGQPPLVALDDGTANARALGVHFETVRDTLLRSHPWAFATARAELSALADAPPFQWAHEYPLPADCLRLLTLNGNDCDDYRDAYEIEGKSLLCNSSTAQITYIRRVTDTGQFDASFADAFAKSLAEAVALVITGSPADESRMEKRAQEAIEDAALADARESGARVESPFPDHCSRRGSLTLESLRGEKGETGDTGSTAYELAVFKGFEGTLEEWLVSLQGGPPGPKGDQGEQGEPGENVPVTTLRINGGAADTEFSNYLLRLDWGQSGATINPTGEA